MKKSRSSAKKTFRIFALCVFSFVFWACLSDPQEILPDESWPRMEASPASGELFLPEPSPPLEADISFERMDAPSSVLAIQAAQEPPLPESLAAPPTPEDSQAAPLAVDEPPPQAPPLTADEPPLPASSPAPASVQVEAPPQTTAPPAPEKPARADESPPPASSAEAGPGDYFPPAEKAAIITTGPPRRISGSVGNNFTVTLPGIGWIYLQDEGAAGKIRYMGKVVERGDTVFAFSPFEKGEYNLRFQQQDLAANTMRYDDVALLVDPPREETPPAAENPSSSVDPPVAQPQPPPVPPSPPAASPEKETALPGETEIQRLQRLSQEGSPGGLAELENYINSHEAQLSGLDELYFFLAQMFEKDTPSRDMKKSLVYYEKVRDLFPLSSRWGACDLRSRYIRLNYFDIR